MRTTHGMTVGPVGVHTAAPAIPTAGPGFFLGVWRAPRDLRKLSKSHLGQSRAPVFRKLYDQSQS